MTHRRCPHCQKAFTPSRYHPDQVVCSQPDCQRRRRADYHREKIQSDPEYAQVVRDSQKKCSGTHLDYLRKYRKRRARPSTQNPLEIENYQLKRLLEGVKNNVALDLRHCSAEVYLICRDTHAKNSFAPAQVIVIEAVMHTIQPTDS